VSDNGRVQAGHSKEDAKEKCVLLASWFLVQAHLASGRHAKWTCPSDAEYMPSMCKYSFIKIAIHGK
jgi:hypothetical protein